MPLLPFIDYQVSNPLSGSITLSNNQSSPATAFSYTWSGNNSVAIEYSVTRGSSVESGRMLITTDGTNVSLALDKGNTADTGITFSGIISGASLLVQYTSTNTGQVGSLQYIKQDLV